MTISRSLSRSDAKWGTSMMTGLRGREEGGRGGGVREGVVNY